MPHRSQQREDVEILLGFFEFFLCNFFLVIHGFPASNTHFSTFNCAFRKCYYFYGVGGGIPVGWVSWNGSIISETSSSLTMDNQLLSQQRDRRGLGSFDWEKNEPNTRSQGMIDRMTFPPLYRVSSGLPCSPRPKKRLSPYVIILVL